MVCGHDGAEGAPPAVQRVTEQVVRCSHLGCKGLIELKEIDVLNLQASLLDGLWDSHSWPHTHDGRVHPNSSKAAEDAQDGEAAPVGLTASHHQGGCSTIADLQGMEGVCMRVYVST